MPYFEHIAQRVRRGDPLPRHWDLLLRAATPVTRAGMALRFRKPVERVDATVISYGNLTAGGTGKTPAVIACVKEQLAAARRVAVLTRGYGSAKVAEPFAVPPDMPRAEIVRVAGDEPALIRHHAPECVIIKAARRAEGARRAIAEFGCDSIILDDGFQHVQLARDKNICLIDASNPFGNGHLIPRGILRELPDALRRATHIELTRCDQAADLDGLLAQLEALAPGIPIRKTIHAPVGLWRVCDGEPLVANAALDLPVTAVSAIGNPEAFHRTLAKLDFTLKATLSFRDHAAIPAEALQHEGLVVVTEKDAMRLGAVPYNVVALQIALRDFDETPRAGG